MKNLSEIAKERDAIATVAEITSAFEGIASMHIAQIKDQVLSSQIFFKDLWGIYKQIRVGQNFHFGRGATGTIINKELIIIMTAESGFSGELDRIVVEQLKKIYDENNNDVIVVGSHGAAYLSQNKIPFIRSFKAPISDKYINVLPLSEEIQKYKSTQVIYPSYVSLTSQDVKTIQLSAFVAELGEKLNKNDETISELNYIFEPSTFAVVDHLERTMIVIMMGNIILEAKLAQYASRFRAMNYAKDKANKSYLEISANYNRSKRLIKDERAKEILNGLRKARI